MRRGFRVRPLVLAAALTAALIVAAAAFLAVGGAIERQLAGFLPAGRIADVVQAARGAVVAGSAAVVLVLVVPLALGVGDVIARPIERLRTVVAGMAVDDAPTRAVDAPVTELALLCAAIARLAAEHHERMAPLSRERDELALIIDSVGEGILRIGPGGRVVRANRAAREMLGLPSDVHGQPIASLVRNPELGRILHEAARGTPIERREFVLDDRHLLVSAHPIGNAGERGEARLGAIAVFVDLTELRRLEGVRRDFVANASHELKTPLTSIRGYTETLLNDDLPEETRRRFLETVHANATRLQGIVDDLLDLSRLESGAWTPDLREIDVLDAARDAWHALADKPGAAKIAFRLVGDDAPAALADPVGIRHVLSNLLDNAIRHTPAGGSITVRARGEEGTRGGGYVVVEVADTGAGIPGDALPRIFERFYRVDPARSRAGGGTGLGLAIVRHLVEQMGGDVAAESELGKGTTIRFRLPASPHAPALTRPAAPATPAP
jgi:signal transduction histidine kinase